jgi:hypothetical protein
MVAGAQAFNLPRPSGYIGDWGGDRVLAGAPELEAQISAVQALIQSMSAQTELINTYLASLGIEMELARIHLRSEECEHCVEYVYVIKFKDPKLYEAFVKQMKAQKGG